IFGPADPPDRKPETVSVPTTPSLYSPPSGPGKWTTIIALAKGKPLLPDEVNLEKNELATIERGLPENAFRYANPKSPKGALLIHSTYSLKRGDSLSLDGWTICRHDNGSPKLAVQFDNDNRKGPLRLWDADTKLRLYASYTNDRLHGPACLFENGKPSIVMNYVGNQLKDKYLVDYQSGRPVARPVEELPPDLAQTWAAGEKQFEELSDEIKQQEIKFKKALKSAFEEYQRNLITMRSQKKRQRDKMNETRSRAEWQASAARTIGAMAIGAGGGF
ncbi:MAG TPA: hypothetical protein VFE62_15740, partial [Gemmataceae bacterium]|nr:hypothetical protein [Gemmataceae bacterium]